MTISEKMFEEDGRLIIQKRQVGLDSFLDENKAMADMSPSSVGDAKFRLAGRIPYLVAEAWARECGAAIGTKEFGLHVRRKLADGEFAKLRVKGF